jgi:hypothetical protein
MQIHITPRHFRLSANLRQAGAAQILTLEGAKIGPFGAHVALIREDVAGPSGHFIVRVHASMPGPDFLPDRREKDIYLAGEQAVSKAGRRFRESKRGMWARTGPRIECGQKKAGTSVGPNGSEQKAL